MSKDGISPDGYFVEEQLLCILGMQEECDLRNVSNFGDYPRQVLIKANEVITNTRLAGVKHTNFTDEFAGRLVLFLQADVAPVHEAPPSLSDLVRVVTAQPS